MTPETVADPSAFHSLGHHRGGSCLLLFCRASFPVGHGVLLTSLFHIKAKQRLYQSGQPAQLGRAAARHLRELAGFGCPVLVDTTY